MSGILDVYSQLRLHEESGPAIPFIGRGNIWIDNTYDPAVIELARSILFAALANTAPGQLSITGYDRDLSGIFAPFASLSAGEARVMEFITSDRDFEEFLLHIRQQIQSVQNVVQGRERSLERFRAVTGRPVESYSLVVLSLDMGMLDNTMRTRLSLLMRSGPAAGISFLIISSTMINIETRSGRDVTLPVEALAQNITVLETDGNRCRVRGAGQFMLFHAEPAGRIVDSCGSFIEKKRKAALPVVRFEEIHDLNRCWDRTSVDGLTFTVGKYGINDIDITIGDEVNQRHNVLITGAVGQGKSNLISVIIHSLCLRYSPRELNLYLLDFKEGVTFKPFSNIGQPEYLPHAKALGLESDAGFGISVLETLYEEYQRRMKLLKEHNLKSIRELRTRFPDLVMPRIAVVIDEFQMMFGEDRQTGQKAVRLLERSVRLYRAAGIHFILASQTLGGNESLAEKKDQIFGQIPVRIALKNSAEESRQTLSINNSEAAFLRPREAIVNLDYGEISQNRKTVIAFADEELLIQIRKKWWKIASTYCPPPYVFENEKRLTVTGVFGDIAGFRNSKAVPRGALGEKIAIGRQGIFIPMSREPGRNIAIIGTSDEKCSQASGMMQSAAVSLAAQNPDGEARFIFCDFEDDMPYEKKYPDFARLMERAGYFIESLPREAFTRLIEGLAEETGKGSGPIYIFGLCMDRWNYTKEPYGEGSVLKKLVESGPSRDIHFFGWWIKASYFNHQVTGYGNSDAFNTKIFLRVDERTVQSMTNPFIRWAPQENRGLISDEVEFNEAITFVPYAPVSRSDESAFRSQVWE